MVWSTCTGRVERQTRQPCSFRRWARTLFGPALAALVRAAAVDGGARPRTAVLPRRLRRGWTHSSYSSVLGTRPDLRLLLLPWFTIAAFLSVASRAAAAASPSGCACCLLASVVVADCGAVGVAKGSLTAHLHGRPEPGCGVHRCVSFSSVSGCGWVYPVACLASSKRHWLQRLMPFDALASVSRPSLQVVHRAPACKPRSASCFLIPDPFK
jgi:hypothetical protein